MTNQIFFELIQVAIGRRTNLSHTLTAKEWEELYRMAESQAILGICFAGVKRLQGTGHCVPVPLFIQSWHNDNDTAAKRGDGQEDG